MTFERMGCCSCGRMQTERKRPRENRLLFRACWRILKGELWTTIRSDKISL